MQHDFAYIFEEYYSLFRGRVASVPVFGDREFNTGIRLANNSIRKWVRADGVLWRELIDTLQRQSGGIAPNKTLSAASIAAPTNMRKPPAYVRFYSGTRYFDIKVSRPQDSAVTNDSGSYVYFIGGANKGYTMYVSSIVFSQYTGWSLDYIYDKNPTFFEKATDPSATVPDMSDVNFMIQDMVSSRAAQARNGFLYKTARNERDTALANMKIENDSGTWDDTQDALDPSGWGMPSGSDSGIIL